MALWSKTDGIKSISVIDGGTGYTDGAGGVVTITAGTSGISGATATAQVVGGVVQGITVTAPGTGLTNDDVSDITISVPGGSGLTYVVRSSKPEWLVASSGVEDPADVSFVKTADKTDSDGVASPGWERIMTKKGYVAAVEILSAGTGYVTNGTYALTFTGGGGTGAAGTYDVLGSGVASIGVGTNGTGYFHVPTVSFTG